MDRIDEELKMLRAIAKQARVVLNKSTETPGIPAALGLFELAPLVVKHEQFCSSLIYKGTVTGRTRCAEPNFAAPPRAEEP